MSKMRKCIKNASHTKSQGPLSKQSKYCNSVSFTEAIMRKCFMKQQTVFFPYRFGISKPTLVQLFPVQLWGHVQINSNHIHWNVCFACMRSLLLWNFLCNLLITGGVYFSFGEIWLHASEGKGIAILNVEEVHIETKLSAVGLSWSRAGTSVVASTWSHWCRVPGSSAASDVNLIAHKY